MARRTCVQLTGTMAAFLLALATVDPLAAAPVVTTLTVGGDERAVEIELTGSEPLNYALAEEPEPFVLTLVLGGTTFAFPDERRTFTGVGLVELRANTMSRDRQRLARLQLVFSRAAPYAVTRDGGRVRVRVELPAPSPGVTIGAAGEPRAAPAAPVEPPAAAPPAEEPAARETAAPAAPPATAPAQVRAIRPDSAGGTARLMIDLDGAPEVRTSTLSRPDRVIVDLEGAQFLGKERSITVGPGVLRRVRVSQFSKTVVRIVCDLDRPAPFFVETAATGLVVHLGEGVR